MKTPGVCINDQEFCKVKNMSEPYNIKGRTKADFQLGFIEKVMEDKELTRQLDAFKGELCYPGIENKIAALVKTFIHHKLSSEYIPLSILELPFSISLDHSRIDIIFHRLEEITEITIDPWPILAALYEEMCKKTWDWGKNQVVLLERAYLETKKEKTTWIKGITDYPEDVKDFLYTTKKDYDYVDNERIARQGDADAMRQYLNQKDRGCCGVFDTCYQGKDGSWYLVGFNYGHRLRL